MAVGLCLLGSTGSIGQQTLDVVARHPDAYEVIALTAHRQSDRLYEQCVRFKPRYVVCVDKHAARALREQLKAASLSIEVLDGLLALSQVVTDVNVDVVMSALVGAVGLLPTLAAIQARKRVLLANKESLVMAGHLIMQAVRDTQGTLLPVDSEHNALFQCMPTDYLPGQGRPSDVSHVTLTASGGPFRTRALNTFDSITPQDAVAHPNWSMGAKISVDSATMMNKGFEVIEAAHLFALPAKDVRVVIHPQSIVHSFLHYQDGSVQAQCGPHDMRIPIAYCLSWPTRLPMDLPAFDFTTQQQLDFLPVDWARFPCLSLAYEALRAGPSACIVLNTVNEMAVAAFLDGKISFKSIEVAVASALDQHDMKPVHTIDDVLALESTIRAIPLASLV